MFARAQISVARFWLCLLLPGPLACDSGEGESASASAGESEPDNPDPHVRFAADVDLLDLCGTVGATHVFLRASRVGCVGSPPAPCTLPAGDYQSWVGPTAACPNATVAKPMTVDVPNSGKYQVEAVTLTESGEVQLCFGDSNGESVVLASADQVMARAKIYVEELGGPCPEP